MGTIDYAGKVFTLESFTDTTDGSGEIVVTLANTPTDDQSLLLSIQTVTRLVEFKSRSGAAITLVIRKNRYDRTDQGGVGTGSAADPPAGVNLITAGTHTTSSIGSAVNTDSGQTTSPPHSHTVNSMFQHDHTDTETDFPLATTEAVKVTVGYAFG